MEKLRIGDLLPLHPDAAELIDSAQSCAKKLAECCAVKDATIERYQHQVLDQLAEIERLREDVAVLLDYAEDAASYMPEWAEQKWGIRAEIQKIKAKREGR